MPKFLRLLLFFIPVLHTGLLAQILPIEGKALHYRLIGYSFPSEQQIINYKLEIAAGNCITEDSFKKNIIKTISAKKNKIIAEVPSFGSQYTWRVIYTGKNSTATKSEFHHFSTTIVSNIDTTVTRLRIIKPAVKYKDAYVFLDGNRALYDITGNPIWYLPNIEDSFKGNGMLSDIKLSPQGTITFLLKDQAYEINYNNGAISGETSEHYHHEFTRLNNGHYMVLGNEFRLYSGNISPSIDTGSRMANDDKIKQGNKNPFHPKTEFGTLIEYDAKGNVTWSWKSSDYFIGSDLEYYKPPNRTPVIDVHENSFFFDEKNKTIYISFRNISRIIKIKYPEGTVLNTYGEIYKPGIPEKGNGLFCNQHSCRISQSGNLYLFNNNFCNMGDPSVIMMQEPAPGKGNLKIVWEYKCPVDDTYAAKFPSGGNAIELPDQSMFVSTGSQYNKLFIVSRDKKLLWSAVPEQNTRGNGKWNSIHQYKACIISRKELEHLIWNAKSIQPK